MAPKDLSLAADRMAPRIYPVWFTRLSPTTDLRVTNGHPFLLAVKVEQLPPCRWEFGYDQGAVPRGINLQPPVNGVLGEQLDQNWARLLKANPAQVSGLKSSFPRFALVVEGTGHYSFISYCGRSSTTQYTRVHLVRARAGQPHAIEQRGARPAGPSDHSGLVPEAKTALDIAWVDATYAYAALIIALFESSAQPNYTHDRALTALVELDDCIHQTQLTLSDQRHPDAATDNRRMPQSPLSNSRSYELFPGEVKDALEPAFSVQSLE
ncbi:hypothetical protein DFP72DRAFT_1111319 [Ephemerocybe angulata]|uniref:Uncharacterized protein n=1 Tax=Ephemerocybe angulata TaxID=980116 RepID=A0A8H6I4R0_9AGAR|nr:hypothetical protein DFP72DRAFT_1111319 [Tulosesus angulatus]